MGWGKNERGLTIRASPIAWWRPAPTTSGALNRCRGIGHAGGAWGADIPRTKKHGGGVEGGNGETPALGRRQTDGGCLGAGG